MLVEAAAQSSSAIGDSDADMAYLVSLKNIRLLISPIQNNFQIEVVHQHSLGNMNLIDFNVFEDDKIIANGSFTVAIELNQKKEV